MLHNEQENPLYANYEYLLELAKSYQFAISLGDGLRPGTVADASDASQFQELIVLGELVRKARKKGVQVIVEGPGHLPMNQIAANVKLEKTICDNAPFYVLGPLVTDIAPGYDHIVGAIGAALAAYHGADFICYVTPGEHLALPTVEDVREGVVAARVAVHAAEVAKGDLCADAEISRARSRMDWAAQFQCAVDPEKAKKYRERRRPLYGDACSMCGEFCAIKIANSYRYAFSRSENAVQRAAFFAKRKTQTGKKSRSENAVQRAAFALRANANRKK
jgi:phosphomethylpyrimidine synthase